MQKDESQMGGNKKKHEVFEKVNTSYPLIGTC